MQKKLFAPYLLALAVLACAVLLDGCQFVTRTDVKFDVGSISKAQRIEVSTASGGPLRTLEGVEEIEAFVKAVSVDGWSLSELPEGLTRECAFTLFQTETVTALVGQGESREVELCTFHTYQDADFLTIEAGPFQFHFSIPAGAAAYLHSFIQ